MTPSFGMHKDKTDFENIPDDYLCWMCAAYKGGVKAVHAGEKAWDFVPVKDYLQAREILKERGYNTKGVWPKKEV